jgi:hypothetical protein
VEGDVLAAVSLLLLATSTSWATVALGLGTGIIGFAGGAAAAAVVTTRHERVEAFRTRMIEAADEFVEQLAQALEVLDNAHEQVQEFLTAQSRAPDEKTEAMAEVLDKTLASAEKTLDHISRLIPRLYVIFRGRSVGNTGSHASLALGKMQENIRDLRGGRRPFRKDPETGELREVSARSMQEDYFEHRASFSKARDDLLKRLNAAIRRNWRP